MGNKLSQFINRASTSTNRTVTIKKDWSTEKYTYGDNVWSTHKKRNLPDIIEFTFRIEVIGSNNISSAAKAILTAYSFMHQIPFCEYIFINHPSTSIRDNILTLQKYGASVDSITEMTDTEHYENAFQYRINTFYVVLSFEHVKTLLAKCIPLICGYNGMVILLTGFDEFANLFIYLNVITGEQETIPYKKILNNTLIWCLER